MFGGLIKTMKTFLAHVESMAAMQIISDSSPFLLKDISEQGSRTGGKKQKDLYHACMKERSVFKMVDFTLDFVLMTVFD